MTRGCDRRETFQVHSVMESRLKYMYGEVLRLKNDSNVRGSIATEDIAGLIQVTWAAIHWPPNNPFFHQKN